MASEQEPFNLKDATGIPADRQFYTIGYISQMFSIPPHAVLVLAHDTGVGPVYSQNTIPTFDGTAVERMVEHSRLNVEFASKVAAAQNN